MNQVPEDFNKEMIEKLRAAQVVIMQRRDGAQGVLVARHGNGQVARVRDNYAGVRRAFEAGLQSQSVMEAELWLVEVDGDRLLVNQFRRGGLKIGLIR